MTTEIRRIFRLLFWKSCCESVSFLLVFYFGNNAEYISVKCNNRKSHDLWYICPGRQSTVAPGGHKQHHILQHTGLAVMLVFVGQTSVLTLILTVWHLSDVGILLPRRCCCYVSFCVCPTQPAWRMIRRSACCQCCHQQQQQHTPCKSGELSHELPSPESKDLVWRGSIQEMHHVVRETGWRASVLHRGLSCSAHPAQCFTLTRAKTAALFHP